jgi:phosphate transport system protein
LQFRRRCEGRGETAKLPGLLALRSRGRTGRSEGINMTEHTTRAFDADLHGLALKIAEMSRLDETQIRQSIEALVKRDIALANGVIAASGRVDALQREIEEKAIVTIARRQPMAIDLREIVGALRICNDLEKIGDLAENVAKEVILLTDAFLIDEVILQLQRMGSTS